MEDQNQAQARSPVSKRSNQNHGSRKKEKARKEIFIGGLPLATNLGKAASRNK